MSIKKVPKLNWSDQFKIIEGSSNFHKKVGQLLATDLFFKRYKCYQEVYVKDLIPGYPYHGQRFDWYIQTLNTVIELHGQQHYSVVNFGSVDYDKAIQDFYNIQERDSNKQVAAIQAGFKYVEIPYTEYKKLDSTILKKYILGVQNEI